jgi:NADPH-dependent glutamate synthase beta subunit-like oxidoreductase/dihydroorotate dehydrogenase/ferredoxin
MAAEMERCEYCEEKPCRTKCPVNCSPADFIMAAKVGTPADIGRAAAEIMTYNPLGGVCGLVCPDWHCMSGCSKRLFDRAINIPALQATIVDKAKRLGVMPTFPKVTPNGKRVAVIGAGPAGLATAGMLARYGYSVSMFEKEYEAGGTCHWIPNHRLTKDALNSDIEFLFSSGNISIVYANNCNDPLLFLNDGFDAVVCAAGLMQAYTLNIANEDLTLSGAAYLKDPQLYECQGNVLVVGGGATAADCAMTARLGGAKKVEMIVLETLGEMPLTNREMRELIEHKIEISGRTKISAIERSDKNGIGRVKTIKVELEAGQKFSVKALHDLPGSESAREHIDQIIVAIGNRSNFPKVQKAGVFYAGDCENGPTTVVEAVAAGKNTALMVHEYVCGVKAPKIEKKVKSHLPLSGYNWEPVSLASEFFGRPIINPFILSASPVSDGYDQMAKAYKAGWAGGVMKTAFCRTSIHIPGEYMHLFNKDTYGNCDNVSGHPLERVCEEIGRLVKDFPDRLTIGSTGGPVTGNDQNDKAGWQNNTKMLEKSGAHGIEYSLSCPQGGDGTEGDIVSQNAALTAKIIDWVMEVSDPNIPKLFKLTAAVTSIASIMLAIKKVLDKYPNKKAGVTLANTFPTLAFRQFGDHPWEEGIVVGMSGEGVLPISNLTLASVAKLGIKVSGNGGPMDYKAAANFLALGAETVQFCTIVTKYGYGIIHDLTAGLSHLLQARGISSVKNLIGLIAQKPIVDFMALSPTKKISQVYDKLCEHCGNCSRCPYLAISLNEEKIPVTNPEKCIGCGICAKKCFAKALYLRDRTEYELKVLRED